MSSSLSYFQEMKYGWKKRRITLKGIGSRQSRLGMLNNMRLQGYAYLSTFPSVINLPNVRLLSNFRLIVERKTSSSGTEDMVNLRLSFFLLSSSDCAMFGYPSLALMLRSRYSASDTSKLCISDTMLCMWTACAVQPSSDLFPCSRGKARDFLCPIHMWRDQAFFRASACPICEEGVIGGCPRLGRPFSGLVGHWAQHSKHALKY